jgi:heme exporter protein C
MGFATKGGRAAAALALVSLVAVASALCAVFFVAPLEATMGIAQKIFYFHVGSAMNMLLSFGACAIAGGTYLAIRGSRPRAAALADAIGVATAEVGVTLGAIVLVTGPLWARKAWGTWWTWEPRLTLSLMVFLLFLAYIALRAFAGGDRFGRGVAAGLSILGIPAIYFIHFAVGRWGGNHPEVVYKGGLTNPSMVLAFWLSVAAMALVATTLAVIRATIEVRRQRLDELFLQLDREDGTP